MNIRNLIQITVASAALLTGSAWAASPGPATLCSGAARLNNGSVVILGQPFAGVMSGGGMALSVGALSASATMTDLPASPMLGAAILLAGRSFSFSFSTQVGRNYVIEASTNLAPSSWVELQSLPGNGAVRQFTDSQSIHHPHRFYRVQAR